MSKCAEQEPLNSEETVEFYKINQNQKTFLGRTLLSWTRILTFYLIYYTFLGLLFILFITQYQKCNAPVPGGTAPKIRSRLDMPGASAYPFNNIYVDGDQSIVRLSVNTTKEHGPKYIKGLVDFLNLYKETGKQESCDEGASSQDILTKTCKVPNYEKLKDSSIIKKSIQDKEPIVTLALNKIFDWQPKNNALEDPELYALENNKKIEFIKNAVYFRCYQSEISGAPVKEAEANFTIEYMGDPMLKPHYFPYKGKNKYAEESNKKNTTKNIQYLKPFVIIKIKPNDANSWNIEGEKPKTHYFRCKVDADNIEAPNVGDENVVDTQAWSADLTKLCLGFVQFAIQYVEET